MHFVLSSVGRGVDYATPRPPWVGDGSIAVVPQQRGSGTAYFIELLFFRLSADFLAGRDRVGACELGGRLEFWTASLGWR